MLGVIAYNSPRGLILRSPVIQYLNMYMYVCKGISEQECHSRNALGIRPSNPNHMLRIGSIVKLHSIYVILIPMNGEEMWSDDLKAKEHGDVWLHMKLMRQPM